jgi:dethiobiotin synthetase
MRYFVSGIDTEVGKTVVSAILTEALNADYWKPVQAGDLHYSDSDKIRDWVSNPNTHVHPEGFRLKTPASPHYAAELDGVDIRVSDFQLPTDEGALIVEGAGGLLVPINRQDTILDVIAHLGLPVILVSKNYLGSINHTLSSLSILKNKGIPLHALVFNGAPNPATEDIIIEMGKPAHVIRIPDLDTPDKVNVATIARTLKGHPALVIPKKA